MSVVARLPPLVAVIVTGPPTPTPATRPVEETFAILGSADDQLMPVHVAVGPAESMSIIDSWVVWHEVIRSVGALIANEVDTGNRGTLISCPPPHAINANSGVIAEIGRMDQPR